MDLENCLATNRDNWDSRVGIHAGSDAYELSRYRDDPDHLSGVVAFDRTRIGDVAGKKLIHLQCHIGTDTISLARLGADVTGTDFSENALAVARQLSVDADTPVRFVLSELYETAEIVGETFDFVYTGVGAICWLPNIADWAKTVAMLLKPGAKFYIREGHPVLWALDEKQSGGKLAFKYPYFESEPTRFEAEETYAGEGVVSSPVTYDWNHGVGEVLTALIDAGLRIDRVEEYDFTEWKAFDGMVNDDLGHWRLPEDQPRIPMMWSINATRDT